MVRRTNPGLEERENEDFVELVNYQRRTGKPFEGSQAEVYTYSVIVCHGIKLCSPPQKRYIEILNPVHQKVISFGNRVTTGIIG